MKKIAKVKAPDSNAIRLMICDKGQDGVFVFGYDSDEDGPASWDAHYADLEDAYEMGIDYGIKKDDWQMIDDSLEFCQDDWIKPVRVKGRNTGKPQWGSFECLVNGEWQDV